MLFSCLYWLRFVVCGEYITVRCFSNSLYYPWQSTETTYLIALGILGTVACVTLLYILVYDQSCRPSARRHLSGSIMQPIRAETQTAPPSANFEALALRGAPECARCDAKDGDYAFDRATKRLICTACAQNFICSNNDTAWQHLHPKHRRARERMLIGLGRAFQVIEMPEMRAIVVECERNLWYNANSLTEYLDHSTLQRRLQHFVSTHQLDTGGSNPPSTRHSTAKTATTLRDNPYFFLAPHVTHAHLYRPTKF